MSLISVRSKSPARQTMDRLEAVVRARGLTVFARVDHAKGAAAVGMDLRPTEVLLFGSPRAGTPLMQLDQRVGIDLPLKVLVWENAEGEAWLSYEEPHAIATRRGLGIDAEPVAENLGAGLAAVVAAAAEAPRG